MKACAEFFYHQIAEKFSLNSSYALLTSPPLGGVPCRGGEACVTLRPPGLCRREPCAPGRSNHAGLVCAVRVQTKAPPAGELYKPPKGRKTLTENHWPSRSWGLGGRPITCPRKIQKITETVTYQEQISNGEALAVDGGTAGHTMTSVGKGRWKKNPGKRDCPAGRRSGAQRKTGLVGERQLQPYAPHGMKRNN